MEEPGTIDDLIEELKDWLDEVDELLDDEPDPIPESTKATISMRLSNVEQHIDNILDPNQSPSLNPTDAGADDQSITPSTLSEYRQVTVQLAQEAKSALNSGGRDDDVIGSRIKTIKRLLDGYRQVVGID